MILDKHPYSSFFLTLLILVFSVNVNAKFSSETISFWEGFDPKSTIVVDHSVWDSILNTYVNKHIVYYFRIRFDYAAVTESDKSRLNDYLKEMQSLDPRELNRAEQKAFWMNLYNATAVSIMLDNRKKASIKDIKGVWGKKRFTIVSQKLSLNDITNGILRPIFRDPRVHFGLTPATIGSGDIIKTAYSAENVDRLLESNTSEFFNAGIKGMIFRGQTLVISSIFKWYREDFGNSDADIKAFIKGYVNEKTSKNIDNSKNISYHYNWGLNTL